jgi:redox-sensitive bicupin YhaK (pirin superfamily)
VTIEDVPAVVEPPDLPHRQPVELVPGRPAQVGSLTVHRVLPRRPHRTVGAWCFADLMDPVDVTEDRGVEIGPHPHMGLQTVTWLVSGELVHRDSLGSEQPIRTGQLNLMTAGHGIAHAEENTGRYRGELQGAQLWVAQPDDTRDGPAAFEHHAELPKLELGGAEATVLVGDFGGAVSPARRDTDHVGVDLALTPPGTTVPLRPEYEYAVAVLVGSVALGDLTAERGTLAYLGTGREECRLDVRTAARALLLGGRPFDEPILMWWNFVARTRDEVSAARRQWAADDDRFGDVRSGLRRIEVDPPPWE